ncbi:MAG: Rieske (2Fe-2S) protein [Streptosporangiaceae bacterium]
MSEVFVAPRTALADGTRFLVEVDGVEIGVLEHAGELFAYENRCAHQGGPVCEGIVLGQVEQVVDGAGRDRGARFAADRPHLICPWHGWEFELRSGDSVAYPDLRLRRVPVVERDGGVYVAV